MEAIQYIILITWKSDRKTSGMAEITHDQTHMIKTRIIFNYALKGNSIFF